MKQEKTYDFKEGEVLLLNKPLKWTSFDVVKKARSLLQYKLKLKKIKVAAVGTLDPLADGLLIVCTGRMTKQIESFQQKLKTYTGTITLGGETPSYDLETEVINKKPIDKLSLEDIVTASTKFNGEILQLPPIFSAKKIEGKKAYNHAREGNEVKLAPVPVTIHEFIVKDYTPPKLTFEIICSKGTYIRSLAHDLGQELGCGGYLSSLSRTAIGEHLLRDALSISDLEELIESCRLKKETV